VAGDLLFAPRRAATRSGVRTPVESNGLPKPENLQFVAAAFRPAGFVRARLFTLRNEGQPCRKGSKGSGALAPEGHFGSKQHQI
jgi:hypothetical protein